MEAKLTIKIISGLKPKDKAYEVRDSDVKGFLLRVQPTGGMTYYLSYINKEGKKQRYKIGRHGNITLAQAREAVTLHGGRIAVGEDIQQKKKKDKAKAESNKSRTLGAFLNNKYGPWVKSERKSGNETVQTINALFGFLMDTPLDQINQWVMDNWRVERRKTGVNPNTINRNIATLKALLSKAVEWDAIATHPLTKLKPLKIDNHGIVRYLTSDEEKQLRAALIQRELKIQASRESGNKWRNERGYEKLPDIEEGKFADHLRPMVLLSINTGMRRGEVFNLNWSDISFSNTSLTIRGETAKSGKTRHIPLNAEALNILKNWRPCLNPQGLVFPSIEGKPFDNVNKAWHALLDNAGIENFRWHDMRHHFASRLVMCGVDLNTVRELLGHSSLDMTIRYAHLAPEHKAEAVARLV